MYFSRIFRVKEGKLEKLKEWFDVLSGDRRMEAVATFAHENVTREVFALFKGNDDQYYVIGFNETSGPLQKGDPNVKINQEHAAVKKECLDPISDQGEVLFDQRAV
jgi:Family of unknown function (DUF6176)